MPKFFYIARDRTGKKITGTEDATVQDELISRLQARDLVVVSIIPAEKEAEAKLRPEVVAKVALKTRHSRITNEDLVLFCRQLATLLGAGVTILKSLEIISKQVSSRRLFNVIKKMEKDMEAGLSLHEAMAKHKSVFSELWVNIAETGEASGNLAEVLNRLASYLERNAAFRGKIVSALIYPVILLVVGLGALLFLTIKIIPTFADLFKGFDIKLPLLTQMLIAVSSFIQKFALFILGIIAIIIFMFRRFVQTKEGRRKYEAFLFRLPTFGEFFRAMVIERFSSEMSTLIESGVPILYSLEIAEHSVNNLVLADILHNVKDSVREGMALSRPMEKSGFFEPMVVQMVAIGEEIGELAPMFKKINAFYRDYVETFLTRFTAMFEPMMLVCLGVVIGLMVIGMFLPIFQIAQLGGE